MANQLTEKRYEKKYLLTKDQYNEIKDRLKDIATKDEHGNTTICNIYFDTPDFKLIRKSLDKPIYKEKLRLRSYGTANENTKTFLEIKKKYKGVVYKRRSSMKLSDAEQFINTKEIKNTLNIKDKQVLKEVSYMFENYEGLAPRMFICYDREPLFTNDESSTRITFDSNILYRTTELTLDKGAYGDYVLDKDKYIMEIKTGVSIPLWLSNILNELKIYPASFSKYGVAYKKYCEEITHVHIA